MIKLINTQAYTNSENGKVGVYLGAVMSYIPTTFSCKSGDTLQVQLNNGVPCVIGVIGRGDETQCQITLNRSDTEFIAAMTDVDIWDDDDDRAEECDFTPSKVAIVAKKNYESGLWPYSRIQALYDAGKITYEEFVWIVGENAKSLKKKKK